MCTQINDRRWEKSGKKSKGWCDCSFQCFHSMLFVFPNNAEKEIHGESEERETNNIKKVR